VKPSVGRIVHYMEERGDDDSVCRAAIVTLAEGQSVDLRVFVPGGEFEKWGVGESDMVGGWHWPEREQ